MIETIDGNLYPVLSAERFYPTEDVKVYNFRVADWHTYYVSEIGILVHNDKCGPDVARRSESGTPSGGYQFKDGIDVDMRGKGNVDDALGEAFKRVQEPKENFYVTKWAEIKNEYGN